MGFWLLRLAQTAFVFALIFLSWREDKLDLIATFVITIAFVFVIAVSFSYGSSRGAATAYLTKSKSEVDEALQEVFGDRPPEYTRQMIRAMLNVGTGYVFLIGAASFNGRMIELELPAAMILVVLWLAHVGFKKGYSEAKQMIYMRSLKEKMARYEE